MRAPQSNGTASRTRKHGSQGAAGPVEKTKDVDMNETHEDPSLTDDLAVEVRGLKKRFGAVHALRLRTGSALERHTSGHRCVPGGESDRLVFVFGCRLSLAEIGIAECDELAAAGRSRRQRSQRP